jgi:hypothetical protein
MERRNFFQLCLTSFAGMLVFKKIQASGLVNTLAMNNEKLAADFFSADGPTPYTFWQWMNGCITKEGIT